MNCIGEGWFEVDFVRSALVDGRYRLPRPRAVLCGKKGAIWSLSRMVLAGYFQWNDIVILGEGARSLNSMAGNPA